MSVIVGLGVIETLRAEVTAARRRMYFYLEDAAGDPVTNKAGEQPDISIDGAEWTSTGIGTLSHIGSGYYYAEVTTAALTTVAGLIMGRFDDAGTVECMALNALLVGGMAARAAAPGMNKVRTDRDTAETTIYDQDGTTELSKRKRQASGDNAIEIVPV